MPSNTSVAAFLGATAWLMAACQGPTLPLSAQQGSSILVPIGNDHTVDLGLIGFGGTLKADPQRGQLNFFLDLEAPAEDFPLTTRTTSMIEAARSSILGRYAASYGGAPIRPYMVVSLVEIPLAAPTGDFPLRVERKRGTEPGVPVPYRGRIKVLPSPASGISGAVSTFVGTYLTGLSFTSVAWAAPDVVPDPTIVIALDPPVHSVELAVFVPSSKADVADALEPLQATRTAAHQAFVTSADSGNGTHYLSAVASRDDLPLVELGLVFQLKPNQTPLTANEVIVIPSRATDENGYDVLPIATSVKIR